MTSFETWAGAAVIVVCAAVTGWALWRTWRTPQSWLDRGILYGFVAVTWVWLGASAFGHDLPGWAAAVLVVVAGGCVLTFLIRSVLFLRASRRQLDALQAQMRHRDE